MLRVEPSFIVISKSCADSDIFSEIKLQACIHIGMEDSTVASLRISLHENLSSNSNGCKTVLDSLKTPSGYRSIIFITRKSWPDSI